MNELMVHKLAPLMLRIALGAIFIYHGWEKITEGAGATWHQAGITAGQQKAAEDHAKLIQSLREKGATISDDAAKLASSPAPEPLPGWQQMLVAWGEFLGGIALLTGIMTRLAALGIMGIMGGAIYTVTGAKGFSLLTGGYEYNFALIAMCLVLVIMGAGAFSLDRMFWQMFRKDQSTGTRR